MTKTYVSLQRQIDKLQKEAAAVKASEIGGVIDRIKVAISFYGLTAADLFEANPGKNTKKPRIAAAAKPKKTPVIKYSDGAGNTWTGHGKRPGWFKAAIEGGKTAEELTVKAE